MKRISKLMPPLIAVLAFVVISDQANSQRRRGRKPDVLKFLAQKYDSNKDGELSKEEYDRSDENFKRFDTNKDGVLTATDWSAGSSARQKRGRRSHSDSSAPSVGDAAPDFALKYIDDEKKKVKLSSFAGDKPVALVFGSCT